METLPTTFSFTTTEQFLRGEVDGKPFILRGLSGEGRDLYMGDMVSRSQLDPKTGKPTGKRDFRNFSPALLGLCLFSIDPEGKETKVKADTINKWPGPVVAKLFDYAKQLSGLEDAETEEEKEAQQKNGLEEKPSSGAA